mgnify:CR=1 FL=1
MAKIRFSPNGGARSNCSKFSEKTFIASSSAFSLVSFKNSVKKDGFNNREYASVAASSIRAVDFEFRFLIMDSVINFKASVLSTSIFSFKIHSLSPR